VSRCAALLRRFGASCSEITRSADRVSPPQDYLPAGEHSAYSSRPASVRCTRSGRVARAIDARAAGCFAPWWHPPCDAASPPERRLRDAAELAARAHCRRCWRCGRLRALCGVAPGAVAAKAGASRRAVAGRRLWHSAWLPDCALSTPGRLTRTATQRGWLTAELAVALGAPAAPIIHPQRLPAPLHSGPYAAPPTWSAFEAVMVRLLIPALKPAHQALDMVWLSFTV
jgi:hypothetical protein